MLRSVCAGSGLAAMELEQSCASSHQYWTDIDAMDHTDPMACTAYVHDIVCHLLEAEVRCSQEGFNLLLPGKQQPQRLIFVVVLAAKEAPLFGLHGGCAAGRQPSHAQHTGGLAGRGRSGVQASV